MYKHTYARLRSLHASFISRFTCEWMRVCLKPCLMTTYALTFVHVQKREHIVRSRHTVFGTETTLRAGQTRITFSIPGRGMSFACIPKREEDRLFSGYQCSVLGVEGQERTLIIHLSVVLRLKIRGPIPPRLLTFLWYAHEQVYFTSLSFVISNPVKVAETLKYFSILSA